MPGHPSISFEEILLSDAGDIEDGYLYRAKIPGGWLVVFVSEKDSRQDVGKRAAGTTFVPDTNHEWDGSSLD